MQEMEGKFFPISFASKKLNKTEQNYSATEKECMAIVWAIKKFGSYSSAYNLHYSLQYLDKSKFIDAKLMRWSVMLQQYCY